MNSRFIEEACYTFLFYVKKEGTKGSFYQRNGKRNILPQRLSLGNFAQRKVGSKDSYKKSEINSMYKISEEGLYYSMNERKVHTSIYSFEEFPEFYGYGIIDERFEPKDLLIFSSENNFSNSFEIHLFRGLGKPEYLKDAFSFLREYQTKKPH